jgi:sensor domain CHASE-containing protein
MSSREELELRKLELEIRDLSRPPWLRAVYLAALLPALLAVLTFVSAWLSGYFDRERIRLKQETSQLRSDRDALKAEKTQLGASVEVLIDALKRSTKRIQEDNEFLKKLNNTLPPHGTVTPSQSPTPQP